LRAWLQKTKVSPLKAMSQALNYNVLIIFFIAHDRLCCTCCTSQYFLKFQSDANHISSNSKPSWRTVGIWSVLAEGNNLLFISSATFSYRPENDNIIKEHISADTDMVPDVYLVHPL